MIGILIVTHQGLAEALMSVWDLILGRQEGIAAVSLDPSAPPEVSRQQIQRGLSQVNGGNGVIIKHPTAAYTESETWLRLDKVLKPVTVKSAPPSKSPPVTISAAAPAATK